MSVPWPWTSALCCPSCGSCGCNGPGHGSLAHSRPRTSILAQATWNVQVSWLVRASSSVEDRASLPFSKNTEERISKTQWAGDGGWGWFLELQFPSFSSPPRNSCYFLPGQRGPWLASLFQGRIVFFSLYNLPKLRLIFLICWVDGCVAAINCPCSGRRLSEVAHERTPLCSRSDPDRWPSCLT